MKKLDLTGKRFGRLVVQEEFEKRDNNGKVLWKCICDCGKDIIVRGSDLVIKKIVSCGCYHNELASSRKFVDITGETYGELFIIGLSNKNKHGQHLWECECNCGNVIRTSTGHIRSGHTKSCGCIKNKDKIIHGKSGTPEYNNKQAAKRRALKLNQTPELTEDERWRINLLYGIASELNKVADPEVIQWHVDHIQPLSNGGLHHPNNLQILPQRRNSEKLNKYPLTPDEEERYQGIRV